MTNLQKLADLYKHCPDEQLKDEAAEKIKEELDVIFQKAKKAIIPLEKLDLNEINIRDLLNFEFQKKIALDYDKKIHEINEFFYENNINVSIELNTTYNEIWNDEVINIDNENTLFSSEIDNTNFRMFDLFKYLNIHVLLLEHLINFLRLNDLRHLISELNLNNDT